LDSDRSDRSVDRADLDAQKVTPSKTGFDDVIAFVDALFKNVVTTTDDATEKRQGSKHFVVAASGTAVWKTEHDTWIRKISSDTAQYALTSNGLTYTQLLALTPPVNIGAGVIVYANAAQIDNMNVFVPKGATLTLSVSSGGTERIIVYYDERVT
jgi:hypothetical protein